ncbi:glucosyltransferase domain-containing protein [Winslowiella sp. 2C04]|uniref:glucosyltransferase domain-containing protein n=1 Tax=Winslowiella sp. 2C04 TaxID=3416179 RepID=UPI003CED5FF8
MINVNGNLKITFIILMMLLLYFPLIINDIPFRDDLSREYWGFVGLTNLGRPSADIIYKILGFGFEGVNLSPLPKLISLILLCISSIILYVKLFDTKGWIGAVTCALVFANPFSLQNFAYQYDSMPMALAVFLATASVAFTLKNRLLSFALTTICLFLSLTLYQSSIIIAACIYCCIIIKDILHDITLRVILKRSALILLSAMVSCASYYLLVVAKSEAISSRGSIGSLDEIKRNIIFLHDKFSDLYHGLGWLFIAITLLVVFSLISTFIKVSRAKSVFILIIILLSYVLCLFPSVLLKEGFAGPRVLMSFGVFMMIIAIIINNRFTSPIYCIPMAILLVHSIVISYAFSGNLQSQQERYRTISSLVINKTQSEEFVNYKRIYILCSSTPSQKEEIFKSFNSFIDWLNPEAPWAIRFFIRNSGEKRIVHDWSNCGSLPTDGIKDSENSFYRVVKKDKDLYFIMK